MFDRIFSFDRIAQRTTDMRSDLPIVIIVALALVLGVFARLKGLGEAPFAVDEYYFTQSILNLLDHGVPVFECGGYYVRGILLQYLVAPLAALPGQLETHVRLGSALSGIFSIGALYYLTRRFTTRSAALIASGLFALSVWEVEFSRFARMYAPFSLIFLLYVIQFFRCLELPARQRLLSLIALSSISPLIYEAGAFLLLANFLLLILLWPKKLWLETLLSTAALAAGYLFLSTDFRLLGASVIPTPATGTSSSFVNLYFLPVLDGAPAFTATLVIPIALFASGTYLLIKHVQRTDQNLTVPAGVAMLALGLFLAVHQFALAGALVAAATTLGILRPQWFLVRSVALPLGLSILLFLVLWYLLGVHMLAESTSLPSGLGVDPLELRTYFLKSPNWYSKILVPWLSVMPVWTMTLGFIIVSGIAVSLVRPGDQDDGFFKILGLTIFFATAVAIVHQPEFSTRYTFFLYPLVLLAFVISLERLASALFTRKRISSHVLLATALILFLVGEDGRLRHLVLVDHDDYVYRLHYSATVAEHYYRRWDYRETAKFINDRIAEPDTIITTAYAVLPLYLSRLDYVYLDPSDSRLSLVAACSSGRDLWSNKPLLLEPNQLWRELGEATAPVWLVVTTDRSNAQRPIERDLLERFADSTLFTSVDGYLTVIKVQPTVEQASPF